MAEQGTDVPIAPTVYHIQLIDENYCPYRKAYVKDL